MALPEPTTRSPGKLVLVYTQGGFNHLSGVRYLSGITLPTGSEALADATALANAIKAAVPGSTIFTGFRVTDPMGAVIIEDTFPTAITGTRSNSGQASNSATVTLTGKGTAVVAGNRSGQTRIALYVGAGYLFGQGQKSFNISGDAPLLAIKNHLTSSTRYWADFYGQKAIVRGLATIQYNAHAQRKLGT